jgi:tetratricopeptide (TPR) repeat protein
MKPILIGMFWLLGVVWVFANPSAGFERGNESFSKGDFAGAATAYEEVIRDQGASAGVLYNLGNSYQRLGRFGPALLAYERARLLAPRDPNLLANLMLARKASAADDEVHSHPRLNAAVCYFSRNEWSWLVAGSALWIGTLSVVSGVFPITGNGFRYFVRWSGALALIVAGVGALALCLRRDESNRAVIVSESAHLRLSPFDQAESLAELRAGKVVRLGERNGEYVYIEMLAPKISGWVSTREVAGILPES